VPKPYVTAKVQNERKAMREQDLLHIEISELKNQIADLEEQLQDISVKYYDAVAVINYLEKFFNYRVKE
jgi:predicted  nucleic acid-binding Zn-ribbon protein